jgi:predicted nuclease with RNAse H fold
MLTAGVDLSSQDANTAMCAIEWSGGRATVASLKSRVADHDIVELMGTVDKVGVDVPFGWPVAFVAAVSQHSRDGSWPIGYDHADNRALRFRRTDLWVHEKLGMTPLSVSCDRIALPAMRAAAFLSRAPGRGALDGSGLVVEVYPAAALKRWGFSWRKYKRDENAKAREVLLAELLDRSSTWLRVGGDLVAHCAASDDAFDAVIAALVARAAMTGLTEPVPDEDRLLAQREGWIALPCEGSFERLPVAGPGLDGDLKAGRGCLPT